MLGRALFILASSFLSSACAIMPDLPPDWAMPQQQILLHVACELQQSLRVFDGVTDPKQFDARGWSIRVTLNPKVDADIQPGAGLTRRSPTTAGAARFVTWVIGSGNGYSLDMRGGRTGSVDFAFDSSKLIDDEKLHCEYGTPSYHALTKYLGIQEWLHHSIAAMHRTGSRIDKPSFSSDVLIKFSGSSGYTYTAPPGADLLNLSGYYQLQETLNINLTAKPSVEKIVAVTLPIGGPGSPKNAGRSLVTSTATISQEARSDLQQIEQAIRNQRVPLQ